MGSRSDSPRVTSKVGCCIATEQYIKIFIYPDLMLLFWLFVCAFFQGVSTRWTKKHIFCHGQLQFKQPMVTHSSPSIIENYFVLTVPTLVHLVCNLLELLRDRPILEIRYEREKLCKVCHYKLIRLFSRPVIRLRLVFGAFKTQLHLP